MPGRSFERSGSFRYDPTTPRAGEPSCPLAIARPSSATAGVPFQRAVSRRGDATFGATGAMAAAAPGREESDSPIFDPRPEVGSTGVR